MVSPEVFAQYQPGPDTGRRSADAVLVREGAVADVPGCLELVESVLGLDRGPWERSLTASVVDPGRMLFVAEQAGRIIGYGRATHWIPPADAPANTAPGGWYLLGLVVTSEHRRCGIGKTLTVTRMNAIAERASTVWCFMNAQNRASLDLHADLGFSEVTRDFWFPDLSFEGGEGVLVRAALPLSGL